MCLRVVCCMCAVRAPSARPSLSNDPSSQLAFHAPVHIVSSWLRISAPRSPQPLTFDLPSLCVTSSSEKLNSSSVMAAIYEPPQVRFFFMNGCVSRALCRCVLRSTQGCSSSALTRPHFHTPAYIHNTCTLTRCWHALSLILPCAHFHILTRTRTHHTTHTHTFTQSGAQEINLRPAN